MKGNTFTEVFNTDNKFDDDEEEEESADDPFKVTGFGITSFLDSTLGLVKMNMLLTIICIPIYLVFGSYSSNPEAIG
jgi:hypothetical protein